MKENKATMGNAKANLRRYLKTIGWTKQRIIESFQEIVEVINAN